MRELILGQQEVYDPLKETIWSFKQANDIVHGINLRLSNMCGGFPFEAAGSLWKNSEVLYLCGEFSEAGNIQHTEAQEALCKAVSGYAAKRFVKSKYKRFVRDDFHDFRIQWMLWCVWQKCKGNASFRELLTAVPDEVILIEDTTTDTGGTAEIWGCRNKALLTARKNRQDRLVPTLEGLTKKDREKQLNIAWNQLDNIGLWTGQNNIGKILMLCRQCVQSNTEPDIDLGMLRSKHIHIFGKEISF